MRPAHPGVTEVAAHDAGRPTYNALKLSKKVDAEHPRCLSSSMSLGRIVVIGPL